MFDITPTEARIPYYKFTFPYLDIPHGVVLHQDNVNKNLLQRKGVRIAVEEGYSTSDYILKAAPGGVVAAYPSTAAALTAVADKQADIYFGNVAAVRYQISENRDKLGVLAFDDNIPGQTSLLTIGTRYDWPILRGIFNKALMGLTPAQLNKITDPWLKGTVGGKIEVDADEQRWLTNHSETTIRASMEPWPPVLYMQDGQARGIAVNYLRHIMTSLELDLTFVEMPWKDTLPAIDKFEKIDVVSSAANTPARRKMVKFTAPFISLPQVIFMRDDARLISGLADLNDKTVAIEAGSHPPTVCAKSTRTSSCLKWRTRTRRWKPSRSAAPTPISAILPPAAIISSGTDWRTSRSPRRAATRTTNNRSGCAATGRNSPA